MAEPDPSTTLWLTAAVTLTGVLAFLGLMLHYHRWSWSPAAPQWRGRVHYVVLCASALRGRAGLDIAGAVDERVFPRLPARFDLAVVVSLTPDRPGRRYQIARIDPGAAKPQVRQIRIVEAAGRPSVAVLRLSGLTVERPGEVVFRVLCDGQVIAERGLSVSARAAAAASARLRQPGKRAGGRSA